MRLRAAWTVLPPAVILLWIFSADTASLAQPQGGQQAEATGAGEQVSEPPAAAPEGGDGAQEACPSAARKTNQEAAAEDVAPDEDDVKTPLLRSILRVLDKLLGFADQYSAANGQEGVDGTSRRRLRGSLVEADVELRQTLGKNSLEKIQRANRTRFPLVVRPERFWPLDTEPLWEETDAQPQSGEDVPLEINTSVEDAEQLPPGEFEPVDYIDDTDTSSQETQGDADPPAGSADAE